MSDNKLNLKAIRCPEAMIYVRRAITNAINAEFKGNVVISTIESSMKRDLALYVENCEAEITVSDEITNPLSKDIKAQWLESGEATQCELDDITHTNEFCLTFR